MADQPSSTIQRIRIGVTGLAFVFLLVLLGAVFGTAGGEEEAEAVATNLVGGAANTAAAEEEPSDPLADLGVTPGAADEGGEGNAAAPAR